MSSSWRIARRADLPLLQKLRYFRCWVWRPRTVFFLRHAERRLDQGDDPDLTQAGQTRAAALAHVLGDAAINSIVVSEFARTHQTAAPLAELAGLTPVEIPRDDVDALLDHIEGIRGGRIVVIGHTTNIPGVIDRLVLGPAPAIEEGEFDNLFLVIAWSGCASLRHLHYGSPT